MILPSESFQHRQAAHCESGVTSNLLKHEGIPLSEAMAFGLGSGLFFIHIPWLKVMGLPLTSYRSFPGTIFKKTCKRLGVPFEYKTYRDPMTGTRALDRYLASNQAVGLQSNIYWLPYIPQQFRFQFNAHNLVVFAKNLDGSFLVSDPVLETTSVCPSHAMTKARFAKGMLSPKGLIYFPRPRGKVKDAKDLPLDRAVHKAIQETVRRMLFSPVPFAGVRGICFLARRIQKWPKKFGDEEVRLNMANVVRMQEEIGTGGAGFRFLYAAFLQEAGDLLGSPVLKEAARDMTDAGNLWRDFATLAAKFCKGRLDTDYSEISKKLFEIADAEKAVFRKLRREYL